LIGSTFCRAVLEIVTKESLVIPLAPNFAMFCDTYGIFLCSAGQTEYPSASFPRTIQAGTLVCTASKCYYFGEQKSREPGAIHEQTIRKILDQKCDPIIVMRARQTAPSSDAPTFLNR